MSNRNNSKEDPRKLIDSVRQQVEEAETRGGAKPDSIGGYRVIRLLGQGGMGIVYEVEQQNPQRTVALKVLRTGILSPEMLRRFEKEAQLLGRLHHVGIAQIYEGGTADSGHDLQPFFAMELVDGLPLTDYCEANKLGTKARLELLAKVCDAVQHAHQNKVIHRDLKPSNILVDSAGQPKILDFGVARVTEANVKSLTHRTEARHLIGTLPYMSPEQIRGDARSIDARSDVYALGVLAYRVLTGRYPYHIPGDSLPSAVRAIQEDEPGRLSLLNRELRGDIETMVLKALEKEPPRRYQSAAGFAEDIRRYLNEEPIRARPASRLYRFHKFARRNRALVGGIGGVIVVLLLGLVVSTTAFQLAERRLEDMRQLVDARDLTQFRIRANSLWPTYPDKVPAMQAWQSDARKLYAQRDVYRRRLAQLHERAIRFMGLPEQDRTGQRHAQELIEIRKVLGPLRKELTSLRAQPNNPMLRVRIQELEESIHCLEEGETKLLALESRTHDCEFEDPVDDLQHDVLVPFVQDLDDLFDRATGLYGDVERRISEARRIERISLIEAADLWDAARTSIADVEECPQYHGLALPTQIGLVPIGRDPNSGLWEFSHILTGEVAKRDGDGELILDDAMGLVFVLIPGGAFEMGASRPGSGIVGENDAADAWACRNERPSGTPIDLAPFFLSKYEMTQSQWDRFMGDNPSVIRALGDLGSADDTPLLPVENISWTEAEETLYRMGLVLPTEAQWEYAARAHTRTPWWSGPKRESLVGTANIADAAYGVLGDPRPGGYDEWLNDGYGDVHAPIGRFDASPFGVHDILGNVAEWCFDAFGDYRLPTRKGDGQRNAGNGLFGQRVIRGGSFRNIAVEARVSARWGGVRDYRHDDVGVRPARVVSLD